MTNSLGSSNNLSSKVNKIRNLTYEKSMTSNTLDRKSSDVQDVPKIVFSEVPDESVQQFNELQSDAQNKLTLNIDKNNDLWIIPEESSIAHTPALIGRKNQSKISKYEFVRCKTQLHVGDDLDDLISEVNLLSTKQNKNAPSKGFSKISNPSDSSIKSSSFSTQQQLKRVISRNFDNKDPKPLKMSESDKMGTGKSLSSIMGESSIEINPEVANPTIKAQNNEPPSTLLEKFIEKTKPSANIQDRADKEKGTSHFKNNKNNEELAAPMFRIDTNTLNLHYIKKRFSNVS